MSRWPLATMTTAFLLCMLMMSGSSALVAADAPVHVRISPANPDLGARLERLGFDIVLRVTDHLEILAHDDDLDRLTSLGIDYELTGRDLFPGARSTLPEGNLDPQYHAYDEMLDELMQLEALYPEICRVYDVGDALSKSYTWGNYDKAYDIWALRISDNPSVEEPEPCVVYDARHHAREPVSTELLLAVARHYCQGYGFIPSVTETVNRTEIWIVPMVNPDGHQWVEDHDPWWRKNLHDHNANQWVDDDEGIDPNRNYDWHWVPGDWWSQTYGGPSPWSAPEVASLRDLHQAQRTCLNPSVHSYGEVILYPFGYGVVPEPAVIEVATELGTRLGYVPEQSTTANGSSKDWLYGTLGGVSFTVETATEFIPTGAEMEQIVTELLPGMVWLATRAWGPSVQGVVRDAVTDAPLLATIRIPEIQGTYGDGELQDMVTEGATGYFCRLRPQAMETITLQVSAPGYLPAQIEVTTGGSEATVVDIALTPDLVDVGAAVAVTGALPVLEAARPNPFAPATSLSFTLPVAGQAIIRVFDVTGRTVTTLVDKQLGAGPHVARWDGRDASGRPVSPGLYVATLSAGDHHASRRLVLLR